MTNECSLLAPSWVVAAYEELTVGAFRIGIYSVGYAAWESIGFGASVDDFGAVLLRERASLMSCTHNTPGWC